MISDVEREVVLMARAQQKSKDLLEAVRALRHESDDHIVAHLSDIVAMTKEESFEEGFNEGVRKAHSRCIAEGTIWTHVGMREKAEACHQMADDILRLLKKYSPAH